LTILKIRFLYFKALNIQPIVEGDGEVDAVPLLLRRLLSTASIYDIKIQPPIKRKRTELIQKDLLQKNVRLASGSNGCVGILVIIDSDDDCPKKLGPVLQSYAQEAAGSIPCRVVLCHREYEAWFLASLESLKNHPRVKCSAVIENPEAVRDAKGKFEEQLMGDYAPTRDQARFSELFDLALAHQKSRSFRKMVKAFGELMPGRIPEWPPAQWRS